MKKSFVLILLALSTGLAAQDTVSALFLGNSYTHRNNMAAIVGAFAKSTGNHLIKAENSPGGYTLSSHTTDNTTLNLIKSKKWDYVVMQEQSQLPSFPQIDVENMVFPAANTLSKIIRENNSCSTPTFYRTWGRKNGDSKNCQFWPPVCTYSGMDSLLALRYQQMADSNNGIVAPVGEVWKILRQHYPNIELYKPDESHPSEAGSYAAACCFYTSFYRLDPTKSKYKYSLDDSTASRIKRICKRVVYNNFEKWNIGINDPIANFEIISNENGLVKAVNTSSNAEGIKWLLNDSMLTGDTLIIQYTKTAKYRIQLNAYYCKRIDTTSKMVSVVVDPVGYKLHQKDFSFLINKLPLSIKIESNEPLELAVINLNGQLISSNGSALIFNLNRSELPQIFIIELTNKKGDTLRKLISN